MNCYHDELPSEIKVACYREPMTPETQATANFVLATINF
mgnify:CR=1 FL=1|jgi:hypothetical protein